MHVLLIAIWLISSAFPLNPIQQDTLNHANMHLTAGINGPNHLIAPGPEVTAKYEVMFHHPFVLRVAFDYHYGKMNSNLYPKGKFHGTAFSAEILYYRGTYKTTGYLGIGAVYAKNYVTLPNSLTESMYETDRVVDIYMLSELGYRLTLGLRFFRNYSLELAITEISPTLVTKSHISENQFSTHSEKIRLNYVRFTLGYLIPLGW